MITFFKLDHESCLITFLFTLILFKKQEFAIALMECKKHITFSCKSNVVSSSLPLCLSLFVISCLTSTGEIPSEGVIDSEHWGLAHCTLVHITERAVIWASTLPWQWVTPLTVTRPSWRVLLLGRVTEFKGNFADDTS